MRVEDADSRLTSEAAERWLLAALMVAAVLVRVPGLGIGLWRDEGATYFEAVPASLGAVIERVTISEVSPPAFFVLMHYWTRAFGTGEIAFKMPAFILGVLLVAATYLLAVQISRSRRVGLLAAGVATFATEAVYYSQEARPYTLTGVLAVLTLFFYVRSLTEPRTTQSLIGFIVCGVLALYTHYTNLLLMGALGIITFALWGSGLRERAYRIGAAGLAVVLAFIPWSGVFLTHLSTGTPWSTKVPLLQRPRLVLENLAYTVPLPVTFPGAGRIRQMVVLVVVVAASVALARYARPWYRAASRRRAEADAGAIAAVTFALLTVMMAGLSYSESRMFPFAPIGWAVGTWLLAALVDDLRTRLAGLGRILRPAVVLGAIVLLVPNVRYAFALGTQPKSGIRELADDLRRDGRPGTIHLVSPDVFASTLGYYMAGEPVALHGVPTWSNPEIFSPRNYVALWNRPTLVTDIASRIHDQARNGAQRLALIQQTNGPRDIGPLRMGRAQDVLAHLRATYPLVETREYTGSLEPVTLYVFALSAPERATDPPKRF